MKIQKITLLDKNGRERKIDFGKTSVAYRAKMVLGYVARMIAPDKK
jgi:hypothetical protein